MIQQQNQNPSGFFNTNNMSSNLTSASGEASASSTNPNNPSKKRRNHPGNPDPDAEVIALSPKSLLATNRFFCEICNKGFQRDQNLQLHRRGHNLPWKLKQRSSKDVVRKKVYVCPEASCVHHDPSRALGDLTGIKKHFCRKHGEKKWKCERCSKKYAVQSDWKAHSKTCGTREYRCDCGTLFSRRDSFITHRAFCDALAQESARSTITANPLTGHHPLLFSQQPVAPHATCSFQTHLMPYTGVADLQENIGLKRERQEDEYSYCSTLNLRPQEDHLITQPSPPPPPPMSLNYLDHFPSSSSLFTSRVEHEMMAPAQAPTPSSTFLQQAASASPHMSATALLQRAAQMGATMSRPADDKAMAMEGGGARHHHAAATTFGLGLPFSQPIKTAANGSSFLHGQAPPPPPLMHDHDAMMNSLTSGFDASPFADAFGAILNRSAPETRRIEEARGGGGGAGTDALTIDFLGSKAYYHGEILNLAGMDPRMSSVDQHENTKKPWIG